MAGVFVERSSRDGNLVEGQVRRRPPLSGDGWSPSIRCWRVRPATAPVL